jgi:hypothetical protein
VGLAFAWGIVGCTALASGTDTLSAEPGQLESAGAPAASPPAADPKWGCLDAVATPRAVALRPTVSFSLRLYDPTTQATPPQSSVRACNRFDLDCAAPVDGPAVPAQDGLIHLNLPQGFAGFLEVTSPAIVPALYFFNPPLDTDRQDEFIVVGFDTARALASQSSVALDPELGMIAVRTMDCTGELSGGVEFSNDKGGVPFAFVDGLPVIGYVVSNGDGIGGFVNVPPGLVVLQGQEAGSSRISGKASVIVRKGWFAYGDLNPAPDFSEYD